MSRSIPLAADPLSVPKAELHCHLEGAAPPALVRRLAERNGIALPGGLFDEDGGFAWHDFASFLDAYDAASSSMRTHEDYRDVTCAYLAACAGEGAIYAELFASPDHAAAVGLDYAGQVEGIAAGIDAAEAEHGIVGRIVVTCVRHLGPDRARRVAERARAEPHPYVVGFGMGGDETVLEMADFAPAFAIAADAGLGCTVHAGELTGPDTVRAALARLPVSRLGHGVRAAEDRALLEELARRGTVLEVCPGSNLAIGLYPDYASHPLPRLLAAGCRVTLGSDDPPYFATSIGAEYARAATELGLTRPQLTAITRTAIEAAFADAPTRQRLRARLEQAATAENTAPTA